jgi:hypothetical protein
MAETRYGKYFKKEPIGDAEFAPAVFFRGADFWDGLNCSITRKCISGTLLMEGHPHAHDFDQVLCFLGADPFHVDDFQAEVEFSLGEEGEKHIIDASTIVYVPKGLIHCPLYFKKVDKPIIFMNIALVSSYGRSSGPPPPPMVKRY